MLKQAPIIKRGEYLIVRVDGQVSHHAERPTLPILYRQIGCDTIDTVTLDADTQQVMIVDDTGMVEGKPLNPEATKLYHAARGFSEWGIHGDVAIVNDEDFA